MPVTDARAQRAVDCRVDFDARLPGGAHLGVRRLARQRKQPQADRALALAQGALGDAALVRGARPLDDWLPQRPWGIEGVVYLHILPWRTKGHGHW